MTPQQFQAMKMALDALELVNVEFVCGNGSHHKKEDRHEWDEDCPITNRWRKAITALKEALVEHAMQEVQRLGQKIEKEPFCLHWEDRWGVNHYADPKEPHPVNAKPLYTTPPQEQQSCDKRTWVGLTDEEFQLIYDMGRTPAGMMEMVEAKLKEKNT